VKATTDWSTGTEEERGDMDEYLENTAIAEMALV